MSILSKPWYRFRPQQIALRCWRSLLHRSCNDATLRLPWGTSIRINPLSGVVSHSIWTTGIYDLPVSEAIYRIACQGDHMLDIGGNIGYMTNLMASRIGTKGRIDSFEPHPKIFAELSSNVELIKRSKNSPLIQLHNVALSNNQGKAWLSLPPGFDDNMGLATLDGDSSQPGFWVETRTLDAMFPTETIKLAKIDVEGHELSVLEGGSKLIDDGRLRNVVFEEHRGNDAPSIQFLLERGFQVFQLGWNLDGPLLSPTNQDHILRKNEAPNYLATLDSTAVVSLFETRGWKLFSSSVAV